MLTIFRYLKKVNPTLERLLFVYFYKSFSFFFSGLQSGQSSQDGKMGISSYERTGTYPYLLLEIVCTLRYHCCPSWKSHNKKMLSWLLFCYAAPFYSTLFILNRKKHFINLCNVRDYPYLHRYHAKDLWAKLLLRSLLLAQEHSWEKRNSYPR